MSDDWLHNMHFPFMSTVLPNGARERESLQVERPDWKFDVLQLGRRGPMER